jgi:type VI protein secretion system component VasF
MAPGAARRQRRRNHREEFTMSSKDYAKDVGMSTAQKVIPMPFVIALIAVILVVGYVGFSSSLKSHASGEKPAKAASQ